MSTDEAERKRFYREVRKRLKAFGVEHPKRICELVGDGPTSKETLYQILGQLDPSDPQHVSEKTIIRDLKREKRGWDATIFTSRREGLSHSHEVMANTDRNVKEGEFTCSRCKSRRIAYDQLQTRKADEGVTTFLRCIDCGKRWKIA